MTPPEARHRAPDRTGRLPVRQDPHRANGATIRAIRMARQLRQEDLTSLVGDHMTPGYLSRIENGTRRGDAKIAKIAEVLGVSVEVLTGRRPAIAILRAAQNITPAAFARDVGITPVRLDRIEQGTELPGPDLLLVIANRLGVDPAALRPHVHAYPVRDAS